LAFMLDWGARSGLPPAQRNDRPACRHHFLGGFDDGLADGCPIRPAPVGLRRRARLTNAQRPQIAVGCFSLPILNCQGSLGLRPQYRLASTSMGRCVRFRCGLGHEKASFVMACVLRQSLFNELKSMLDDFAGRFRRQAWPPPPRAASLSLASGDWWATIKGPVGGLGGLRPRRGIACRTAPSVSKTAFMAAEGIMQRRRRFLEVKVHLK